MAAVVALAGCTQLFPMNQGGAAPHSSAGPRAGGSRQATAGEPRTGQCWTASRTNADSWAAWEGAAATPCAKSHTMYTFAVGHLTGPQPTDWEVSSTNPALRDSVAAAAGATCTAPYAKLLPSIQGTDTLIRSFFFVPSRTQWKSGARWVRCDLALVDFGTRASEERFATLPATISTLVDGVATDPAAYGLCVDTGHSVATGPFADKTDVITDCRDNPEWVFAGRGSFTEPAGAAYPTKAAISARLSTVCGGTLTSSDQLWSGYFPNAADWKAGDRTIECWAGLKSWKPGSGSGANA